MFTFNQAVKTPLGEGHIVARNADNLAELLVALAPDGRHRFILESKIEPRAEGNHVPKRKANTSQGIKPRESVP